MFPIRDHNPSDRTPFVTYARIALNVLIFLSYYPALSSDGRALSAFYTTWGLVPVDLFRAGEFQTLVTSQFLHGGWMHLAGNMLFLWIFGDNLEDLMGHLGFLVFYLASGIAAALGQYAAVPFSGIPMVGASGAIAGVMGGYLLIFPRARIDILVIIVIIFKVFTVPAWVMLGLWFGLQVFSGVGADAAGGGVAYWAHAGGFIAGAILAFPLWMRIGGPEYWKKTHGHPPHEDAEYENVGASRIPRVKRRRTSAPPPTPDLSRVPPSGRRRGSRNPWSGRRD